MSDSAKATMLPFGCDPETSLQDLFEYFKSCLQHGEWELASACVRQLVSSTGGLSKAVLDIIKAIICHPYSLKWESVGSPHKLAWFWLQVLEKWTEERLPPHIRQQLEFLLVLEQLGSEGIAETVLKELHEAFLATQSGAGTTLTAAASCIETLLKKKKGRLAHTLAHFLQEQPCIEDHTLQHTFIQHLMNKIENPEKRPEKIEEWLEEIYTVLALMPKGSGRGDGRLVALFEALWAARDGPLKEERILSCLLRPECDDVISIYCSTALRLQRDHLLKNSPETQVELPEAEKLALSLCCHEDRASAWKTIFFECLSSGKHFLEPVLVTALELIKHEEFSQLKDLLQSEFQPLSRLLLLLGWTHCRSLSSAQMLLSILHKEQAAANDSVLREFADLLSSQLEILEWCKDNNPGISTEALVAQLHTLDNHSALYILHSLTPLAQFEERRILDLLQKLRNLPETDTGAVGALGSGMQRNIVLFQGFCAMKYAIYALCVNAHKYSNCTECVTLQHHHSSEEEMDQNKTSASSQGCQYMFQHYLSECQLYLETVPAVFRLELLENIFSLLFLSTSDFSQLTQKDSNLNTRHDPHSESFLNTRNNDAEAETKVSMDDSGQRVKENQKHLCSSSAQPGVAHMDLGHLIQGCRGFLVDVTAMEGFLKLLKEGLEGMCVLGQMDGQEAGRALAREAEVAASLGCSITAETFGARLQRLSKHTAEAQWRLQIITSNRSNGDGLESPVQMSTLNFAAAPLGRSKSSSLRRRRKPGRHAAERQTSMEKHNGEVSTSASDGGGAPTGSVDLEFCPCGGPHSWLVPAMLSPPESLLMSCIRRGNFMEAHQVSRMFDLEASSCSGELVFMERYKQVLVELGQVEQKMESQSMSSSSSSSEGLGSVAVTGTGRTRLGSSGRSTLQAIGSAAAAGVAFYSISDIADRLLSTPASPLPSLEEGYWLSRCPPDSSGLLYKLLEELNPAAMAAFDLACCHCQLWKTSRQLLDTAERRLNSSLEARGVRVDPKVPHSEGICGFPMVLQQISKILNHSTTHKGSVKTEAVGEDKVFANPFGCCIQEVLLCSQPTLSEESIAARLSLTQRLESTLHHLSTATNAAEGTVGSALLALLVEQAGLKQSELDSHPVRSSMKQLLRSLDQLCPFEPDGDLARPDYVRSFFDYVNTLASVIVRSLSSEDQSSKVKLGNPLLVLVQSPSQLLSHLLFDRQVSPDRLLSLLQQEGLRMSVQQVIVQRCCEALPVWTPCPGNEADSSQAKKDDGVFSAAALSLRLQQHAQDHMTTLGLTEPLPDDSSDSEASLEVHSAAPINLSTSPPSQSSFVSSSSSSSSSNSFLLTASALSFLKSRSPLLATLACLSACKGESVKEKQSSGWSGYFRSGRKEVVLDAEQISREADGLLKEFPILRAYLHTMAEPVLGTSFSEGGGGPAWLGAVICGKPLVSLLLSGPQVEAAQAVAAEAFQKALDSGDVSRALSLLELYGQNSSQERALRDQLLAWAALEDGDEGIGQLFRVQDANLRARVALQTLEQWSLSACLELIEFCLNDPNTETPLKTELELRKKELDIYQQMMNLQPPLPWATWQELRAQSKTNPESVLSMMLEAKEFPLSKDWVQLYPVSDQLRLQLQTKHLLCLLESGQTDEAFQLLEGISDVAVGLDVCERALDSRPGLAACHFLADYLTLHFQKLVSPARRQHIHALHLGSRVLLTLPPAVRQDYFPLLSEPLLMLEQLLMNLKVDWAEVVVQTLRNLLVGQDAGFSPKDIDKLLADYACKALDFSCAPKERSRSDSVISLQDTVLQCPAQDSVSQSSSRIESPASSSSSTPTHTSSGNSGDKEKDRGSSGRKRPSSGKFQPPDQPPARKDWVPDGQQDVCMVCRRERFTMFNRRHHCRRCGRLVCQACSERKMLVDGCPGEEVRVCDQCYNYFHADSDSELEPAEVAGSPVVTVETLDGVLHLPEVSHRQFQLSMNVTKNQLLRSEFYYEQAPSAHLCVTILSLHSDQTACGHQLISHCRSLSRKLTYPEVDACLLTDIMRQLLFSAKLMFVRVGRSHDLALCDSYISKVDVLKILVTANYKYIPSLDDILETPAVARLRNQLLEAEYYKLAVEVSTKSGLDPGGVWQAWAMASLKAGNLTAAREKFARCLKAPLDRNQLNLGPSLLQEVVQHLETTVRPNPGTFYGEDILASLRELEDALREVGPVEKQDGPALSSNLHQECLYYLNTYGTHLALVSFYMRHDCVTEALTYLLNKECPEEVFLEGVLRPSLAQGRLGMLQGIMEKLDPGQDTCSLYLIASCQFLQRRGYYHSLYQLQQFMMDHVRAAMTCIRFFTQGASSYLQLGEQQRWLVRAKEHLKTYLQEQQGRGVARRKSSVSSYRKTMSSSDVSRHMNTIELQLEVTRFLHRCETATSSKASHASTTSSKSSRSSSPPTLFGGSTMKIEVACKVMLGGKNIEEGFGIAYRVIQDFQLEAQAVYVRAGQRLIRQRQYGAVRQLLKCVGESGTATKNDCDSLILSCVSLADNVPADAKDLESLILEIKNPENKIKAYLVCSKLRPAYLLAVKLEPSRASPLVQDVLQAAEGAQDSVMQNICRQWLSEHSKSPQQRQSRPSAQ